MTLPSLTFHILDISSRDEKVLEELEDKKVVEYADHDADTDDEIQPVKSTRNTWNGKGSYEGKRMVVHLFGMTAEGQHVRCDVKGFEPYFYIRSPQKQEQARTAVRTYLTRNLGSNASLVNVSKCEKRELFGFQNETTIPLLKLTFPCIGLFYETRKLFLENSVPTIKEKTPLGLPFGKEAPTVYESNLDPMLRFIHSRNIRPCGWVSITGIDTDDIRDMNDIECECEVDDVQPCLNAPRATAPFKILSWDIECMSLTGNFPEPHRGDPIIQIGCILTELGSTDVERHIFVLGSCDPLEGIVVHCFPNEKKLILAWCQWVVEKQVDILMGYNIFGFDEKYLWQRAESLGISQSIQIQQLNRLHEENSPMKLEEKRLSSSAMGDNFLYLWTTVGRLRIDMFHVIKRAYPLGSYKLDDTSRTFLGEKVQRIAETEDSWSLFVDLQKTKQELALGKSVVLLNSNGESISEKCTILQICPSESSIRIEIPGDIESVEVAKWAVVKDDVTPAELFQLHKGDSADRARIAKYCIQDCQLVLDLYKKLETFNNSMSMANICSVPISYIFLRGQGVKIESLMFKYCAEQNQVIRVLGAPSPNADGYEGAIVLSPKAGLYNVPIGVADFASLYPSTIMSENISHDTVVWVKDYTKDGKFLDLHSGSDQYDNLPGVRYTDIEYDIYRVVEGDTRKNPAKEIVGVRVCRYAQDKIGTIPRIIDSLLKARKAKRKEAEKEKDPFRAALLDSEQLAYKLTANSLYGQLGSGTFKIRFQPLAASVTAYARKQIMFSKAAIEQAYGPESGNPRCSAEIIYGDTDSLFIAFHPKHADGSFMEGRAALEETVLLTEEAGKFVSLALKAPHDFEFDKVYWPFIIFSKKRYVGYKYEDIEKPYSFTTMGVALKRRDYAPIVKKIYGGAIHTILAERNVGKAVDFVKHMCLQLVQGNVGTQPLIISKSLRTGYARPEAIPHKALADRIAARTPGAAPASGDRIPYIYIQPPVGQKASNLQADRIETPSYIKEKGLKIDYMYYIEHQISNPVCQLFSTLLEQIPGFVPPQTPWSDDEDKRDVQREAAAYHLLFQDVIQLNEKLHKRTFVQNLFKTTPLVSGFMTKTEPRIKSTTVSVRKVQSSLDSMFFDTVRQNALASAKKKDKVAAEKAKETKEAKEAKEAKAGKAGKAGKEILVA